MKGMEELSERSESYNFYRRSIKPFIKQTSPKEYGKYLQGKRNKKRKK